MRRLLLFVALVPILGCPPNSTPTPSPTPVPSPTATPTPKPTPTPIVCASPLPPPASRINVKVHAAFCANLDSTIIISDAAYCASIGYYDRKDCPVRMDGQPDKTACEALVRGPYQSWTCSGGCKVYPCAVAGNCECAGTKNTNPAQAIMMGKGTVTTCTADGKACGSLVSQ